MSTALPNTTYLIFFTPRTGSWLLCHALTSSGLAGFPSEYYSRPQIARLCQSWELPCERDYTVALLQRRATANGVFGAKVTWRHFSNFLAHHRDLGGGRPPAFGTVASGALPNLHYVWLNRRDKIRQAVSFSRAEQTGVWWRTASGNRRRGLAAYDPRHIDRLLRRIHVDEARIEAYFAANSINPLRVVYEDFVAHYERTVVAVLEHLGVVVPPDLTVASPSLIRQADAEADDWVRRFSLHALQPGRVLLAETSARDGSPS